MGKNLAGGRTSTRGDLFNEHQFAERNDRMLTPLSLIHSLGAFDLDPCGAPGHRTATNVWTPEEVGDGLSLPWEGRVWLNPPYGRTMTDWMRRLALHGDGTALIFARTETVLFHDWVWPRASALLFLKGRLTFLRPDGENQIANAGSPSVLIAYGASDADALRDSGVPGAFVRIDSAGRAVA